MWRTAIAVGAAVLGVMVVSGHAAEKEKKGVEGQKAELEDADAIEDTKKRECKTGFFYMPGTDTCKSASGIPKPAAGIPKK